MGLDKKSEYELPTEVKIDIKNIKKICGGARHTIILDGSGDLHIAGKSDFSPTGYEGTFKKLELNKKFTDVVCGFDMTAAFTDDNKLMVWGNNKNNQLGYPNMSVIKEPMELSLPDNETAINIKFGLKHTAILTKSHHIFIVGLLKHFKNDKNVLYTVVDHNSIEWLQLIPNVIMTENDITHIVCGQNHISFVIDRHVIYAHGDNKFGQCSQTETSERIMKFESGWTHNGYLTESNSLFLYGRNNYGQLGTGSKVLNEITKPQKCSIYPVNDFSLGAEHGILKSGVDIYTWGWNEHRNCGHDTDEDM